MVSWVGRVEGREEYGFQGASLTVDYRPVGSGNRDVGCAGRPRIRVSMRLATSFVLAPERSVDIGRRGGGLVARGARDT